jgi:hypothetical protein
MTLTNKEKDERMFSIELTARGNVRNVCLEGEEKVLIEGSIGSLKRARFLEGLVLEVLGTRGVLRVDLSEIDLGARSYEAQGPKDDRGFEE